MHRALIFNGASVVAISSLVFLVRGRQVRKELDEQMQQRSRQVEVPLQPVSPTDVDEKTISV
jgi:hypothetical protein